MTTHPVTLNGKTPIEDVARIARGYEKAVIDCGVMEMSGERLNEIMKIARAEGVAEFELKNVCGQMLIGTGVPGPAKIGVHGLMGNHSCAFIDRIELNTYATRFPNGVWCPGDAQVAIGNTSNPTELNVGGSVDDLFASYCPSGVFRVAGQGGNRAGLRAGAGIPGVWREIDYSGLEGMSAEDIREDLLFKYQLRRAKLERMGFQKFLLEFKKDVEDRKPPVIVFGRRVRDYFMEYAQGTIGVILNVLDIESPAGYYICSGMTAGKAFIRGEIRKEQLGVKVGFAELTDDDRDFLRRQTFDFHKTFYGRVKDDYRAGLDRLVEKIEKNPGEALDRYVKIVPAG
ncbi:MAG: hypothetical protein ACNS63_08225 [Candidatus Nitrospinota bacterium M3_3B_026]